MHPPRRSAAVLALPIAIIAALAPPSIPAVAATPHAWIACQGRLDGLSIGIRSTTSSVVTTRQTGRSTARVVLWKRIAGQRCHFTKVFVESTGRIGHGGTVAGTRRVQGTGTTPRGVYTMTRSFGVGPRPATALPYHRVGPRDHWVQDNRSRWYNSLRSSTLGGFRTGPAHSEHLVDYGRQYRYSIVIDYNMPPRAVRGRGAGIFLHVKGSGATAGCVAVTRGHMETVMGTVRPGDLIAIG